MTRRLLLALLLALTALTAIAETAVDLHVFWSLRCPHCLHALPELRQMAAENPWLHVYDYEITQSPPNQQRFQEMAQAHGETAQAVPSLFYCGKMEVGWPD